MRKDYILTFTTEFVVLASGILVYKLAANLLRGEGFSEYAMSRRIVSLIQPALLMGLGVGIPRYIAYTSSTNSKKSDVYFVSGISILIFIVLIFIFVLNLFKNQFAFLMFGNTNLNYLIFPISLMLMGLILHAACYAYFRGKILMLRANFLQAINLGLAPLIAFAVGKSTKEVLLLSGMLWIIVSSIFLISIMKNLTLGNMNIIPHAKELLIYGVQRVPGDFGMAALLSLPAIFTAHMAGVKEAGYVAFGTSLLNMVGAVFAPVGLILLPKTSQMIANKNFKLLQYYIKKILKTTILLTVIGIIIFEIFADKIIALYLGKSFSDLILITRIIMIGGIPYVIYVSLRSIIDAYYVKAINTINILLSLFLLLILSMIVALFSKGYVYIVFSFVIGLFSLGGLTLLEIRKLRVK